MVQKIVTVFLYADTDISQVRSVATHLRCGGIFSDAVTVLLQISYRF